MLQDAEVMYSCRPSDIPHQRKMDGIHGNGCLKRNSIAGVQCAPKEDAFLNVHAQDTQVAAAFSTELAIAIRHKVLRPQKKEGTQPTWLELQWKRE